MTSPSEGLEFVTKLNNLHAVPPQNLLPAYTVFLKKPKTDVLLGSTFVVHSLLQRDIPDVLRTVVDMSLLTAPLRKVRKDWIKRQSNGTMEREFEFVNEMDKSKITSLNPNISEDWNKLLRTAVRTSAPAIQSLTSDWTYNWKKRGQGMPCLKCYYLHRFFQSPVPLDRGMRTNCAGVWYRGFVAGNCGECLVQGLISM
jgi:hypothetical protein